MTAIPLLVNKENQMALELKLDQDALHKALVMAAFAAADAILQVAQTAIPGLKLDPTIQAIALLVIATVIAAVSKAEKDKTAAPAVPAPKA
jgi:hypothetical protein